MNGFEVIDIKGEHLERVVKMIAKFGVPSGADHYENVEKLKSTWKRMRNGAKLR